MKETAKYKKKYEESLTLQDGKKTEVINMLSSAFEKLVCEIQLKYLFTYFQP